MASAELYQYRAVVAGTVMFYQGWSDLCMNSTLASKMSSFCGANLRNSQRAFDPRLKSEHFDSQSTSPEINQRLPKCFTRNLNI